MRIAHVLTYLSADGAFGGPVAVMTEQVTELARRGHHVEVFAGWDGRASFAPPHVVTHLFRTRTLVPGAGFSGLIAPGLVRALRSRRAEFDVVHVHLARDLITTPAAAALVGAGSPRVFVQPHGMVKPDARLRAKLFDRRTRRILSAADGAFALTDVDAARLAAVEPSVRLRGLPNGVTVPPAGEERGGHPPEVLFLARLQARKRVLLFAEAAHRLLDDGVDAVFRVVGPDEGDLDALLAMTAAHPDRLVYEGPVPPGAGPGRIARADLYVLPSLNEPFPMSVLEALAAGTPTVISETCHIADRLGSAVATFADDDPAGALTETLRGLLADDAERDRLGRRGRDSVIERFSIAHVADLLEGYYSSEPLEQR
ncbi:glycosyltransferase [Microbacterium fluvii]|uniref:Glycosyltransferase n=1 Tax=Microbacterium fluvii TaxID=415215 RepID=A0ABW2HI78_9MICO|nr:glycosyltransferase [Microbacterium fluvii]MCU4673937.1 glycosyltransferase [Microbacterium fluvii]